MKVFKCDKCNKEIKYEKDIVNIDEVDEGRDRKYSIFGKYSNYDVCVELKIKGLFDFCNEKYNNIYEDVCIECFYEIVKEIVNNKTQIVWKREDC